MAFIVVALVVGVSAGLATGGRFANLAHAGFRIWPLLVAGLVVQTASQAVGDLAGLILLLGSYLLLLSFAAANVTRAGMGVVFVGIAMNLAVIAVNSGMPVRPEAIRAIGGDPRAVAFDRKHHLESADDRITFLADIIPVPLGRVGEVLSFGDLVMAVGVADVIVHLLRRRPGAHMREPIAATPTTPGSSGSRGSD